MPFLDFNVDLSIFGLGLQVVLLNEWLGGEFEGQGHVFIPIKWYVEVDGFDIGCRKSFPGGTYDAVP